MKWFRNEKILKETFESNVKTLENNELDINVEALLKDENSLIQDHLELLKENQELKRNLKRDAEIHTETLFSNNKLRQENQKLVKALEILKNKKVDIHIFSYCNAAENYNLSLREDFVLTQQEFDLLKEVLGE